MFGHNSKVDLELNREVEKLIKTGGKEKIMPIVQAGEPVLRQQTIAYDGQLSRKTLDKLIDTMRTTMLEAPGVGLAATQIGLGLALVVKAHVARTLVAVNAYFIARKPVDADLTRSVFGRVDSRTAARVAAVGCGVHRHNGGDGRVVGAWHVGVAAGETHSQCAGHKGAGISLM